jgi:hypothetical protein
VEIGGRVKEFNCSMVHVFNGSGVEGEMGITESVHWFNRSIVQLINGFRVEREMGKSGKCSLVQLFIGFNY